LALDPYGRTVAIKKYRQDIVSSDLLQDEIKVMVDLEHQNILKVYDVLKNASHRPAKREGASCFAIVL
jgi:serine/threonine protein kinase